MASGSTAEPQADPEVCSLSLLDPCRHNALTVASLSRCSLFSQMESLVLSFEWIDKADVAGRVEESGATGFEKTTLPSLQCSRPCVGPPLAVVES